MDDIATVTTLPADTIYAQNQDAAKTQLSAGSYTMPVKNQMSLYQTAPFGLLRMKVLPKKSLNFFKFQRPNSKIPSQG